MSPVEGTRTGPWESIAAWVSSLLLLGVLAAMVAALLQTLSLTVTNPAPVDGSNISFIGTPPVDFADRLGVFTSGATNLTIVIILAAAAVFTGRQVEGRWRQITVLLVQLLAAVVIAADVVMAVEVGINHGPLFYPGVDATTRATGIVGLLAPACVAAAAGAVTWFGRRPDDRKPVEDISPAASTTDS